MNKSFISDIVGEDIKLLREEGGKRQHVMSWKYFSGDITSRVIHLYKYPDVRKFKWLYFIFISLRVFRKLITILIEMSISKLTFSFFRAGKE